MQENIEISDNCGFCGAPATKKCSACRQASYCSKEHQKDDWKSHKTKCKPIVVERDEIKGRFFTAARDIKVNEIVLKEEPLVIGPKFAAPDPVCLGCHKPIISISSSPKCAGCRWPICDLRCKGISTLHKLECDILTPASRKERKVYKYELITPLRCLLQKAHNPQKWAVISEMEAHLDKRMKDADVYREVEELYTHFKEHILNNSNNREFTVSQNEFHKICGIIDVNSLDVPWESAELSALYPTFSIMEHSCQPNVKISFNKLQIIIRAAIPINRNECLSTMYTNMLWGTQIRQQHLLSAKYFTCSCARCKDPTELGTHLSSIKCLQDDCNGFLLLENPLLVDSSWKCNHCGVIMPSNDVNEIIFRLTFEVDQILEQINPKVKEVETLLKKLLSVLHPRHYNCFSLKHSLIQLYGHQNGYQYSQLDNELLNRKIEYCQELSSVLSKLDPVGSRVPVYIVVTNYELAAAILETMRRTLLETLNLSLIEDKGKEAKRLLSANVIILNDEKDSDMSSKLIHSCKILYKEIDDILNGQYFTDF